MANGCPVVCSNTSSIPEVVGNAGEYFDPYMTDSIKSAMEKVLSSQERMLELKKRGYERIKAFSWQRCAQETLQVYERLI